jgi:hypothetical protein
VETTHVQYKITINFHPNAFKEQCTKFQREGKALGPTNDYDNSNDDDINNNSQNFLVKTTLGCNTNRLQQFEKQEWEGEKWQLLLY